LERLNPPTISPDSKRENLMSKAAKLYYAVAVAVAIVGCMNTAANLQRETARYIGGNVSPEQVTISDIDRGIRAMDHRAVILDGITVQYVGEVLFDNPTFRHACAGSYRQSLEDFAFGVLFGETLTLSGRMPPVGDTPGATQGEET
jgi:hypothetical protein